MNRLEQTLAAARSAGRRSLIVYLCAGDPDLAATERLVPALAEAGADVIELGVPFSDPLADGPTIQAAAERALRSGTTLAGILDLVERLRRQGCEVPLVLMGYMNPIVRMGVEAFVARSAEAGVDGFIVPDLPLEEAGELADSATPRGLSLVLLAAPTTPPERLKRIGERTRGFLYFVSITGVTGARAALPADLPARLDAVKAASAAPVAVGFGISAPEQARALAEHADAVVVGSALVAEIARSGGKIDGPVALVRSLAAAVHAVRPH
ncbi:MAG TPA: tryptophan synthase subunit alpha [Myxococcaceae bacterium]|nr:tryptophan synthase subunit alpha [Myxococcaceae bacterium]